MAITTSNAAAKAMCDALVDLVDGGTGNGKIVGYTSGDVEVFSCTAGDAAAFGAATTASPSVASLTTTPISDATPAGGNLTGGYHAWETSAGTEIWRGTIGTSGADLNISSLTIATTDTVSVNSYTVSQPTT